MPSDVQQQLPFWLGGAEGASRRGLWTRAVQLVRGNLYLARLLERLVEADENGHPWVAISHEEMASDPRWLFCERTTAQRTVARAIRLGLIVSRTEGDHASGRLRQRRQYSIDWDAIRRIVIPETPLLPAATTLLPTATTLLPTATALLPTATALLPVPPTEPDGETPRAGGRAPSFVRSPVVVVDDERTNERWRRAELLLKPAVDALLPPPKRPGWGTAELMTTVLASAVIVQEAVGDDAARSETELVAACSAARIANKSKLNKLKSILGRRLGIGFDGFVARYDVLRVPPDVLGRSLARAKPREPG